MSLTIDLKGKTALVTGAGRGIGQAIALALANAGANIAAVELKSEFAEETVEKAKGFGVEAKAYGEDVSDFNGIHDTIKQIHEDFGQIDILVNNAGITKDTLIMRMGEAEWDAVLRVNLKGAFNCTHAVTRIMMKQRSGRIVNIASIIGLIGNAGQANYAASKAGLIGLTKSSAKELASRGINVNAVAPGFIQTKMTEVLSEEVKETMLKLIPQKAFGTADDVAKIVLFFVSDLSSYVTGQVVVVDGGMVM
ncbi:MAG: 3-oxoacyl-[acyl-carrier-protein] reductase [Chlamydiae bacterium]|nr:MAG: 3-oxoacyl-[acyl-carrier-protein] reductase [Chlamydiota bacterium]